MISGGTMSDNSNSLLSTLAHTIFLGKNTGNYPILLLGAGCSVNSGCPSSEVLVKRLIEQNNLVLNPEDTTLDKIEKELMTPIFNLNLKEHFSNAKPSFGYWILSELIKKGYFDLILTTNYDTCLEKILSKVMSIDDFRVMVRGDIGDNRILDLLKNRDPRVKIVKLHGDYRSQNMLVSLDKIWTFEEKLENLFKEKIMDKGIIFIGHSMQERAISNILPRNTKLSGLSWYISRSTLSEKTKNEIGVTNIIDGEDGDFDKFLLKLSKKIIEQEQESNKELKDLKNDLDPDNPTFCKLVSSLNTVIDINALNNNVLILYQNIKKIFSGKKNLVFIHDPDCPGGTEVLKILKKLRNNWIRQQNVFKVKIKGREEKLYERSVIELVNDSDEVVKKGENKENGQFILIDSVSFTGGTIEKCKKKLNEIFGENIIVGAAVIFSGPEQEKRLKSKNFCIPDGLFRKVEKINNYHMLFPWGYTSSTKPVEAYEKTNEDFVDKFLPSHRFSFLPRPWGKINSLVENELVSVKMLYLNPGERTSKHKHFFRDEIFYILHEHMTLQVLDQFIPLRKGDFFCVPAGIEHRHIALDVPCWVLEISYNYCDQINDIYRLEDNYDRPKEDGSQ